MNYENLYEFTKEELYRRKRVDMVSLQVVRDSSFYFPTRQIKSPRCIHSLVAPLIANKNREHFVVVALDTKNQPVSVFIAHIGAVSTCLVSTAEILKFCLSVNAASFVICHNHPSFNTTGDVRSLEPSNEDIEVTRRIQKAGEIIGISLLDHLIIGYDKYVSLNEEGHL